MAIQESDIMDFGNGIIGDDTFDVWRKKTNSLKQEIELVEASVTTKINTGIDALTEIYIPQSGQSTVVSTPLQFTSSAFFNQTVTLGGSELSGSSDKLLVSTELESATQLTSNAVKAGSQLILGTKTYTVPSAPAINNAVLTSATTNGDLAWQNAATLFEQSGGLEQTTTVFEEVMPVGSIIALGGLTNDTNYLLCEGGPVPGGINGEYGDLFAVIKYTYGGSGDNFELPDYRGRVAVGTDSAGGFDAGALGDYGGDSTTSTNNYSLKINEIPAHRHLLRDDNGHVYLAVNDSNRGPDGSADVINTLGSDAVGVQEVGTAVSVFPDAGISQTTYTGGGAEGGIHGGNRTRNNVDQGIAASHSHDISTTNRVQPYIAIKYYIKAKKNTKIDFKIDIASSGLVSTDPLGAGQTVISPVNDTIQLDVDPDNTSIALVNGKVAIKTSPTIPGTITTSGPEFILNNSTRAGTNSHSGRALVHGSGAGEGDPVLNGFDRKTVTTINDAGLDQNNDTLIINYNDISPNSFGDYTNGVIINGMKAIMFEDGSILQTGARKRGNFKKETESESGKHHTVAPQYSDAFCYVDDEDDVVIGGNSNSVYRTGVNHSNGHSYRAKMMLPDDEKVDKLYIGFYSTHVIAKSGKTYSVGYGYTAASTQAAEVRHQASYFNSWERSFCESNNCKMSKIVYSGDISCHVVFALDDLGYFWGHGTNQLGCLANGLTKHSDNETAAQVATDSIIGTRESLTNSETATAGRPYNLATNRRYRSHVMNPMLDENDNITTTPSSAVKLLKVTDATAIGSYNGAAHYDTVAILGENGRVYVAGYGDAGQSGNGTGGGTNSHWSTVLTPDGQPLENITKLYSGGEDWQTYFVAIDENYDVWAWGDNRGGQFGGPSIGYVKFATKIWDSSVKNRRANYIITNNAGSGGAPASSLATLIIASHQNSAGVEIDKEFYYKNAAGTAIIQLSHTVFNTTAYSIQDMYFSNGNVNNFYYVLARNKSTNKLELWSSGYNGNGNLGYQNGANNANFVNKNVDGRTTAYRVKFSSDLLEKVVNIHCSRQYNTGANTHVHLSDGRIFVVGYTAWGWNVNNDGRHYIYDFTPIMMD